ncbi:Smr/MutS family protein [Entomospira nematocerorum]|uniref:Smr/MutS family protein n=1 Tax=Entomospira nematocerorum TaxID=2719987 RepID=A0A968GFH2_9SPIO|nr:Smr/MutS family protein [Entomospira nematocera]NIZ46811.1 Smr/MutS family protein [Entomospira nematocera]WDI33392.1 Smr/MutS family protein [Entomospira nematocera]
MEQALELYPPGSMHYNSYTHTRKVHATKKHSSSHLSQGESTQCRTHKTRESSNSIYSMEEWLKHFPTIERKDESNAYNPAKHQKVNNLKAERELDLHGFSWNEAKTRIDHFITTCQHDGIIAVRIIHGKGKRSSVEGGILRQKTIPYLQQDKRVKKVTQAGYHEGQSGACHVILKLLAI